MSLTPSSPQKHESKLPPALMRVSLEHWEYMSEHMMSSHLPSTKGVSSPNAVIALSALYNLLSEVRFTNEQYNSVYNISQFKPNLALVSVLCLTTKLTSIFISIE